MKKILIIGATSAIAQEIAKIYSSEKSELLLVGRNKDLLTTIQEDLEARNSTKSLILVQDLNDLNVHQNLIAECFEKLQTVDVAILAHGVLGNQAAAEVDSDAMLDILMSNFISHASILTHLAQKMILQKKGTIAVISSVAGDRGKQSNYIYGSAKAGKSAFVDGLRNRLFPLGVHVVNFKLGFVDTPMTKDFKKGPLWAKPQAIADGIVKAIELKKDTVYLPFFWMFIMFIIRSIPERIFKKLKL